MAGERGDGDATELAGPIVGQGLLSTSQVVTSRPVMVHGPTHLSFPIRCLFFEQYGLGISISRDSWVPHAEVGEVK